MGQRSARGKGPHPTFKLTSKFYRSFTPFAVLVEMLAIDTEFAKAQRERAVNYEVKLFFTIIDEIFSEMFRYEISRCVRFFTTSTLVGLLANTLK